MIILFTGVLINSQELNDHDLVGIWLLFDDTSDSEMLDQTKSSVLVIKENSKYIFTNDDIKIIGSWKLDKQYFTLKKFDKKDIVFSVILLSEDTLILNYRIKMTDPDIYYNLKFNRQKI